MVQAETGACSPNGALWQTLTTLDWLLAKFEYLKEDGLVKEGAKRFNACINLG
jgi:hypothetical protein